MEGVIASLFTVVVVVVGVLSIARKFRSKAPEFAKVPPDQLGIQSGMHLEPLVDRLENALDDQYMDNVRQRVLGGGEVKDDEYDWCLLELKRFFLLTSVLKHVPMYSGRVDEIWHEMVLFTREYEAFCHDFVGEMIHHEPNVKKQPNPEERAWFEWCYSQFFTVSEQTEAMYGQFFRHPLSKELLADFQEEDPSALRERYFRTRVEIEETEPVADRLIERTKQQIAESQSGKPLKTVTKGQENLAPLALYMLYFSIVSDDPDTYDENMTQAAAGPGYADGGGFGGGDSSGPSCGSGCGAGCGGGCGGA